MRRIAVSLLLLAGCADRITTTDYPIDAASQYVWSGGSVLLHSAGFVGADSVPVFTVGTDTLVAVRADTNLVRLTLPDTSGWIEVVTSMSRGGRTRLSLDVRGYLDWLEGPGTGGNPTPIPGSASFLANGDSGLVRFNAMTGFVVRVMPDSLHDPTCNYSPGLSVIPGVITSARRIGGTCRFLAWLNGVVIDSGPPAFSYWTMTHLGSGTWLAGAKHFTYRWVRGVSDPVEAYEEPEQVVVSPSADRVFQTLAWSRFGVPAYDSAGRIAYHMSRLAELNGVVFDSTGDTAIVVGQSTDLDTLLIMAIDPVTGAIHRSAVLPDGYPSMMIADPDRPWLYLSGYASASVRVVDRRTFEQVAVLRIGPDAPRPHTFMITLIALNPGTRSLYVISVPAWFERPRPDERTLVYRYSLLP